MSSSKSYRRWLKIGMALAVSLLAFWRLPSMLHIQPGSMEMLQAIFGLFFVVICTRLLLRAFPTQDRRAGWISYSLGFFISLCLLAGKQLSDQGTFLNLGRWQMLGLLLSLLLYTVLLGSVISLLLPKASELASSFQAKRKDMAEESTFSRLTGNGWLIWIVLLLAWIPVWLALWPGIFRYDATWQFDDYVLNRWSTHHPLLHTLLHGWCLKTGLDLTGSMTAAVAIYSGLQMMLMAGIFAYSCHWLWKRKTPPGIRLLVIALFALFPLYPIWSFTATKDVPFSGFLLLLTLQIMDWWSDAGAALKSPKRIILFMLTGLLMMLMRHNGIHVLLFATPFLVLAARKTLRIRTGALCACAMVVYLLVNFGLIQVMQASYGKSSMMLSVPLQQLLRVAVTSPETLSDEEMQKIQELYGDEDIRNIYIPGNADPNIFTVDNDLLKQELPEYLGLWLRLGIRHPIHYLEATFAQNLPYFDPSAKMSLVIGCNEMEQYPIDSTPLLPQLHSVYEHYAKRLVFTPLPGSILLSSPAFMMWLCLLCMGIQGYRRQRGVIMAGVLALSLWVTSVLGPIPFTRYALGLFYCVPIMMARIFGEPESPCGDKHEIDKRTVSLSNHE